MAIISLGLDLGRSGQTIPIILGGDQWKLRLLHIETMRSVSAPFVEERVNTLYSIYTPGIIVIESNGPGGVFIDYLIKHNSSLPVVGVDTSVPPTDLDGIELWGEGMIINAKEFYNVRAAMYWLTKLLFRDRRITLPREDTELFAQLSTIMWMENRLTSKIQIDPKKGMKTFKSDLGEMDSTRSPDKADAFCLAALGYALIYQDVLTPAAQVDEVTEPPEELAGFFPLGQAGIETL